MMLDNPIRIANRQDIIGVMVDSQSSDRKVVWVRTPRPADRLSLSFTREN
jgi:hypothetical protein